LLLLLFFSFSLCAGLPTCLTPLPPALAFFPIPGLFTVVTFSARARDLGAAAFLPKPFSLDQLSQVIRRVV